MTVNSIPYQVPGMCRFVHSNEFYLAKCENLLLLLYSIYVTEGQIGRAKVVS